MGSTSRTDKQILALISIPIFVIFLIAICSQYYALLYTRDISSQMQEQLFQSQIMFSSKYTMLVSQSLNKEAQKFPNFSYLMNGFVAKIFAQQVKQQLAHRNALVCMQLIYSNTEDRVLTDMFYQNTFLVNSWYHKNHTDIATMDPQAQQTLFNIYRFNVLQKPIEVDNARNLYNRQLMLNDMLYVMQYEGVFITSGKNSTFTTYPQCYGPGLFPFDPRCKFWYTDTAEQESMIYYAPILVPTRNFTQIVQLICSQITWSNSGSNKIETLGVLCQSISLTQFQEYFSNFASATKKLYFIEPSSQSILYQSNSTKGMKQIDTLDSMEFQYLQSQQDAFNLNNTIKEYFTEFNYQQLNQTDLIQMGSIEQYSKQINYTRNGTKTLAILSPVIVYERLPNFPGVPVPSSRQKYNVNIPYLQINIISDQDLRAWANELQSFFTKYFLILNICIGIIGVICIFITITYSFGILKMINSSILHLTEVLQEMIDLKLSNEIMQMDMSDLFLSEETLFLYQSFQGIYQIMLYTTESFFEKNQTETLLRLNRNIEFFKQFGNYQAVGITYNNIGSILLAQGHYLEAMEQFNASVIYGIYEIEQFCKAFPMSFSVHLLSEFSFTKDFSEIQKELLQPKSMNRLSSFFKSTQTRRSTSKSKAYSICVNPTSNILSQQTGIDSSSKGNSNQDKLSQFLLKKQLGMKDITNPMVIIEEHHEQRIILLENIFYRKRNYILTLLAFQENSEYNYGSKKLNHQRQFNFWEEIKSLCNDLLQISKQLPNCEFQQIEINSFIIKCEFFMEKEEKSKNTITLTEQLITSISHNKSQILKIPRITQDEIKMRNKTLLQEKFKQQLENSSLLNSKDNSNSFLQVSQNMNESGNTLFLKHSFSKGSKGGGGDIQSFLGKSRLTNLGVNQPRKISKLTSSPQQQSSNSKDLEQLFQYKRKLESTLMDTSLLSKYYSIDNLEVMYYFNKAECLAKYGNIKKAAMILISIIETKQSIISHFPFKIASLLKRFFREENIQSQEFDKFYSQFNKDISMQVVVVVDGDQNNQVNFKSIQLVSDLVSQVLDNSRDQLGIVIVNQVEKFILSLLPFTQCQQIKSIVNRIIESLNEQININSQQDVLENIVFQLCEELEQRKESQNYMNESAISFQHQQFSFNNQAESPSKLNSPGLLLDNIEEKDISQKEESKPEEYSPSKDEYLASNILQNTQSMQYHNPSQNNNNTNNMSKINSQSPYSSYAYKLKQQKMSKKAYTSQGDSPHLTYSLLELSDGLEQNPNKEKTSVKQYYFHMAIHKTLSNIFKNEISYYYLIKGIFEKTQIQYQTNTLSQKFIIYSTDILMVNQNLLFMNLCQILCALNIRVIILALNKGTNFIEKKPNQIFTYKNFDVFRVFYTQSQVLTFLQTNRNKFCENSYPIVIQHY